MSRPRRIVLVALATGWMACSKSEAPTPQPRPTPATAPAKPKAPPLPEPEGPPVRRDGTMFGTSELMGTTVSLTMRSPAHASELKALGNRKAITQHLRDRTYGIL